MKTRLLMAALALTAAAVVFAPAAGSAAAARDGGARSGPGSGIAPLAARASAITAQHSGVTAELSGVSFSSGTSGWAVGAGGTVVSTVNGGKTWKRQRSGITNVALTAVDSLGSKKAWAVSDAGDVLRTANGGTSWSRGSWSGTHPAMFFALDFVDGTHGWIAGLETRPILQNSSALTASTTDGGRGWTSRMPLETEARLGMVCLSVDFVSAQVGYALINNQDGESRIYRSDDGGATWNEVLPTVADTLRDVSFSDVAHGWAAGRNNEGAVVFRTVDGGATWDSIQLGVGDGLEAAQAVGAATLWVCGDNGFLGYTADGGETWNGGHVTGGDLNDISFVTARSGWAAGGGGTILRIKL